MWGEFVIKERSVTWTRDCISEKDSNLRCIGRLGKFSAFPLFLSVFSHLFFWPSSLLGSRTGARKRAGWTPQGIARLCFRKFYCVILCLCLWSFYFLLIKKMILMKTHSRYKKFWTICKYTEENWVVFHMPLTPCSQRLTTVNLLVPRF